MAERTAELAYRARQLQKLTLELTQAEERERRRIAVILHEDLQQQIAGAKFQLNLVRSRARDDACSPRLTGSMRCSREPSRIPQPVARPEPGRGAHERSGRSPAWLVKRRARPARYERGPDTSGDMILHSEALAMFLFRAPRSCCSTWSSSAGSKRPPFASDGSGVHSFPCPIEGGDSIRGN